MTLLPNPDISRMCRLAIGFLRDADLLEESETSTSDGASLLRLIAFEILLKALLKANGIAPPTTHKYHSLFLQLPFALQQRLLTAAAKRYGSHATLDDPERLFESWERNFVLLRYSYEPYEGMSFEEVRRIGKAWIEAGGAVENAEVAYYPLELGALTQAIHAELRCAPTDERAEDGA